MAKFLGMKGSKLALLFSFVFCLVIACFSFSSSNMVANAEEASGGSGGEADDELGGDDGNDDDLDNDDDMDDMAGGMPDFTGGDDHASEVIGVEKEELVERMKKLMPLIDSDSNNQITEDELRQWLLKLRQSVQKKQVATEVKTIDKDKDGFITLLELKAAYGSGSDASEEQMKEVDKRFTIVDKNKDGKLDPEELSLLMEPAGDPELLQLETDEILSSQDKDHDGKITFAEFAEGEPSGEDEKELRKEFSLYDVNQDGVIDRDEIGKVIADPHQHEVESAIGEMKAFFKDGAIDADTWVNSAKDLAISAATDNGEVLRVPEEYPGLDIPFKNVPDKEEDEEQEREEL